VSIAEAVQAGRGIDIPFITVPCYKPPCQGVVIACPQVDQSVGVGLFAGEAKVRLGGADGLCGFPLSALRKWWRRRRWM